GRVEILHLARPYARGYRVHNRRLEIGDQGAAPVIVVVPAKGGSTVPSVLPAETWIPAFAGMTIEGAHRGAVSRRRTPACAPRCSRAAGRRLASPDHRRRRGRRTAPRRSVPSRS